MRTTMKGRKTLLLLANPFFYKVAKSILEKMGCEVTDEIDASHYDFIIVDDVFSQSGIVSFLENEKPDTPMIVLGKSRIVQQAQPAKSRRRVPLAALN